MHIFVTYSACFIICFFRNLCHINSAFPLSVSLSPQTLYYNYFFFVCFFVILFLLSVNKIFSVLLHKVILLEKDEKCHARRTVDG
jgi:hypothetical protein